MAVESELADLRRAHATLAADQARLQRQVDAAAAIVRRHAGEILAGAAERMAEELDELRRHEAALWSELTGICRVWVGNAPLPVSAYVSDVAATIPLLAESLDRELTPQARNEHDHARQQRFQDWFTRLCVDAGAELDPPAAKARRAA